jgi:hypothetical protein
MCLHSPHLPKTNAGVEFANEGHRTPRDGAVFPFITEIRERHDQGGRQDSLHRNRITVGERLL